MTENYTAQSVDYFTPPERECPVCGPHRIGALTLMVHGDAPEADQALAGEYCLRCYMRWIAATIPRLRG